MRIILGFVVPAIAGVIAGYCGLGYLAALLAGQLVMFGSLYTVMVED